MEFINLLKKKLSREMTSSAAAVALQAMIQLKSSFDPRPMPSPNQDATLLRNLQTHVVANLRVYYRRYETIDVEFSDSLQQEFVDQALLQLSDSAMLVLALVTWHFGPGAENDQDDSDVDTGQFLRFISSPYTHREVLDIIKDRFIQQVGLPPDLEFFL